MSRLRKTGSIIVVLLAILVVFLAVIVPRIADIDRYRPEIVSGMERRSGRRVAIRKLQLTVLPALSIRADGIVIGNPPGFPGSPFIEIHRAYANLELGALLHREITVKTLRLENPNLSLVFDSAGRWNSEGPAAARAQFRLTAWERTRSPTSVIASLAVEHGRVTVAAMLPSGGAAPPSVDANGVDVQLSDVNSEALGIRLALGRAEGLENTRYFKGAKLPDLVDMLRTASALESWQQLEAPPPRGPIAAHGTLSADSARFGALQGTRFKSRLEIYQDGAVVREIALEILKGRVTGDLLLNNSLQPPRYSSRLALAGIDVSSALLSVPNARGKLTGTLDGTIEIRGSAVPRGMSSSADPFANIQGKGAITIRNGSLPAIRLNPDLNQLMKNVVHTETGSPDPSSFRSMSADFEVSEGQIRSQQIVILGNGINLNVSGSLAIEGAGKLDYRGTAEVMARRSVGNLVAGLLGSKMDAEGKITFPFTLTGTLSAPRFDAPRSPFLH